MIRRAMLRVVGVVAYPVAYGFGWLVGAPGWRQEHHETFLWFWHGGVELSAASSTYQLWEAVEQWKRIGFEVIGDDDPRTWEADEAWRQLLDGKDDHDPVELTVYIHTLREILDTLRPGWRQA